MKRSKKILIYKLGCAIFAVALLLFLPQRGQAFSDIRVLATVLGIDGGEGNYTVSAQLAVPVAQGGDGKASTVAKATGGSMSEALEHLELGLGRRIDYGHLSTVAIGKGMQLTDVIESIGYLMSSGKAGPGSYLVYCSDASAGDFIAEAQKMGESSDAELSNFISYSKSGNRVSTMTALKFLQTLNSTSHASFMPCVMLEDENASPSEGSRGAGGGRGEKSEEQQTANDQREQKQSEQKSSEQKSGEESGQSDSQKSSGGNKQEEKSSGASEQSGGGGSSGQDKQQDKKLVSAESVAVFGGDGQDALILDTLTTRGIVWQDPNSDFGLAELRNVQLDGEDIPSVPVRLTKKTVKRSPTVQNGENVLTYTIKLKMRLDDSRICGNPLFYDKWRNALEREFESVVRNNILHTVAASKQSNIDFLGLRECFHKYCRKGYESFDLQKVAVEVDARVAIIT